MNFDLFTRDLAAIQKRNRTLVLAIAGLVMAQLLSLIVIVSILGGERTVIVPPTIDKTFWVTKARSSRQHLEEMASFIAWLALDVSPSDIDWKRNVLLNYVAPEDQGPIRIRQDLEADRLRRINATTHFSPQQLAASETHQSVVVTGRLQTRINGAEVGPAEMRSFLAEFRYAGGRVHLKTFKEVPYAQHAQARTGADAADGAVAR